MARASTLQIIISIHALVSKLQLLKKIFLFFDHDTLAISDSNIRLAYFCNFVIFAKLSLNSPELQFSIEAEIALYPVSDKPPGNPPTLRRTGRPKKRGISECYIVCYTAHLILSLEY